MKEKKLRNLKSEIDKAIETLKNNKEVYKKSLNIFNYTITVLALITTFLIGLNIDELWEVIMLSIALVCSIFIVLMSAIVAFMRPRYGLVKDVLLRLFELRLNIEIQLSKNQLNTLNDIENTRIAYHKIISEIYPVIK